MLTTTLLNPFASKSISAASSFSAVSVILTICSMAAVSLLLVLICAGTALFHAYKASKGVLDFNKDKKPAEQSGESAAAGLAPLDFDKEKAEEEAKHEDEPDPFDDIFKIFNRER